MPEDIARLLAANSPATFVSSREGPVLLLASLPWVSRAQPEDLYWPAEYLDAIRQKWHPEQAASLLRDTQVANPAPEPARVQAAPKAGQSCGCEPDECYIMGADQSKDRPGLVIDVIWTSGSIDKLASYQRLGIDEVWFWLAGRIEVHSLQGHSYAREGRSRCLPSLDLDLMCTFLDRRSVHVAKRDFCEALRHAPQDQYRSCGGGMRS